MQIHVFPYYNSYKNVKIMSVITYFFKKKYLNFYSLFFFGNIQILAPRSEYRFWDTKNLSLTNKFL